MPFFTGSLHVTGSVNISQFLTVADLKIPSGSISNTGSFNNSGSITNTGSFNNSGSITNTGSFNNSGSITNTGSFNNSGSFTNSGSFDNSGSFTNSGSFINLGPTQFLDLPTSPEGLESGSLWVSGSINGSGYLMIFGV